GAEYTVAGELIRKSDGTPTGIAASRTFTPVDADGSIAVSFAVPEGFAGETLVAFEELFAGPEAVGTPIAAHRDIDDAAQTIVVEQSPATPGNAGEKPGQQRTV